MAEENNKTMSAAGVAALVDGLSASSRRHRQEVSQDIAAVAAKDPSLLAGHIEAIQCYHGDAEYRDMLEGLLAFAGGDISKKTAKELVSRVKFDAESGNGYIKQFSGDILAVAKGKVK